MSATPLPPPPPPTVAYAAPPMPRRRGLNPWLIRLPILTISGTMLLVIVLGLFLLAFQMRHAERIYPGVWAAGIPLGGLTLAEARDELQQGWTYADDTVFTFRDEQNANNFWSLSAAELGLRLDVDATLDAAFQIGHGDDLVSNLLAQARAWFLGEAVAPVLAYDQSLALGHLAQIAAAIDQPASNAELRLTATGAEAVDGQPGRALDVAATLARLDERLLALANGGEIPLVIRETAATGGNVAYPARLINTALSAPIRLVATTQDGEQLGPWTVTPEQIAALLRVERIFHADGTHEYQVAVDMSPFRDYLATLAPGLRQGPRDARFHFNEQTRQLEIIQPAASGRELNIEDTVRRMEETVFLADNRVVPIAFDYILPTYHNQVTAAELGIRELVSESTTYFTGSSANRRHNIANGASRFDGVIIGPGEEFSFNTLLGDISPETGFLEGQVIFGGRTIAGIGGGICQVSTTVFRAAFTGGFAITERNSHGYRVGYYELGGAPPGLDAAIWQPERDFRFQNNTPHHLLIETSFLPAQDALQFRFYSTRHWQTEIEGAIVRDVVPAPPNRFIANDELRPGEIVQVDYAADGADVTVYRNIYDLNGELVQRDHEFTHYLPWQAVYEVAPGDTRLSNQS